MGSTRIKQLVALTAGPLALLAGLIPTATPAGATPGAAICNVVGSVHLSSGTHVNPLNAGSGTYTFASTVFVCAGSVTGVASVSSSGSYDDRPTPGTFSGSFSTSAFAVGGSCSGNVSGFSGGAVLAGSMNISCSTNFGGVGAVALSFVPNPVTLNTCGGSTTDPVICDAFMQGAAAAAFTS